MSAIKAQVLELRDRLRPFKHQPLTDAQRALLLAIHRNIEAFAENPRHALAPQLLAQCMEYLRQLEATHGGHSPAGG